VQILTLPLSRTGNECEKSLKKKEGFYLDPGAATTTLSAAVISGSIPAGIRISISPLSIPENFRELSQPGGHAQPLHSCFGVVA